jgi:hypothetical protein
MNDIQQVRRAERARQFLESDVWIEAWDAYRSKLIAVWEGSKIADQETREEAKRLLMAGQAARAHLEMLVRDGKVSAETIKVDEARKKWYQRTGTR